MINANVIKGVHEFLGDGLTDILYQFDGEYNSSF
jgi:hypothetical protein